MSSELTPQFRGLDNDYRKNDPDRRVREGFRWGNTPGDVSRVSVRRNSGRKIVPGIDNVDFDTVLGAVHVLWLRGDSKLPTVKEIRDFASQVDPDDILKILSHRRFRSACLERNIQWPANWNEANHSGALLRSRLQPEQAQVLAMVLEPSRDNFQQRLRKAGINAATWMNWLKEPMFAEAVRVSSENLLGASQAAIHASVVNSASSGNVAAQKLYYELTGRHDPAKQQMIDFSKMVGLLLEVLTRHIPDPVIIDKINNDLDRIMGGHNLKEIDVIPANYEFTDTPSAPVGEPVILDVRGADDDIPEGFFDMTLEDEE